MNKFDQLVEDLVTNKITLTMVQLAIRESVRRCEVTPDECKSILCGGPSNSGLIYRQFSLISQMIGGMELAVRRAKDK